MEELYGNILETFESILVIERINRWIRYSFHKDNNQTDSELFQEPIQTIDLSN